MGRSGYSDECENLGFWRMTVARALRSKRGQEFLRETLQALDELPNKRLIEGELVTPDGECCTLGAVALKRKLDAGAIDYYDPHDVGEAFGIAHAMAAEIEYVNDEYLYPRDETPEQRWQRMRDWVARQIVVRDDELEQE